MRESILSLTNSLLKNFKSGDELCQTDLILEDWSIYHTYSSFIEVEDLDLEDLAYKLVDSGVSTCAVHKNKNTWVKYQNETIKAKTEFNIGEFLNRAEVQLTYNDKSIISDIENFALESWYQSVQFALSEIKLCSDEYLAEYIRADLGVITATVETSSINLALYPQIKLYKNGVVTIAFRHISPKLSLHYSDFIQDHLNLALFNLSNVKVNLGIAKLAPVAYHQHVLKALPVFKRYRLKKIAQRHMQIANQKSETIQVGDFSFSMLNFTRGGDCEKLSTLAQTIFSILAYLSSTQRQVYTHIVYSQKKVNSVGNFWSGRPYVFITSFENQQYSSELNLLHFKDSFNCILGRTYPVINIPQINYANRDYRYFDDYSILISDASILYVWSKKGVENQQEWQDINIGYLIYEQHMVNELAEYGYMIHRMLLNKIKISDDLEKINNLRLQVLEFRSNITDLLRYGELREVLEDSLNKFNTPQLYQQIEKSLVIKKDILLQRYNEKKQTAGMLLTILFGILTSMSLSKVFIEPLWDLAKLPISQDENLQLIYYNSVSFILVIFFIILILRLSDRK
ncbi:hypothetical protein [Psychrobacter pygoscelis]|uniref:hypothetical protein n=1 Tax=Psychrobacter pygoscelis TaxID=2488563 RepID=UPI00103EF32B|nr:hypothetical protein [Psychrobacter pygoscelis]